MKDSFKKVLESTAPKNKKVELYKADPLSFGVSELDPIMTEENVKHHYNVLTKNYEKNAKQKGDSFNVNGLFLHNIWWSILKLPTKNNRPVGDVLSLIQKQFNTVDAFKKQWEETALSIEGSGWVALTNTGKIIKIHNHNYSTSIVMLLDMWEHSYFPTYGPDKQAYIKAMWTVYNWQAINERLK